MLFLTPDQQCQSTEGKTIIEHVGGKQEDPRTADGLASSAITASAFDENTIGSRRSSTRVHAKFTTFSLLHGAHYCLEFAPPPPLGHLPRSVLSLKCNGKAKAEVNARRVRMGDRLRAGIPSR